LGKKKRGSEKTYFWRPIENQSRTMRVEGREVRRSTRGSEDEENGPIKDNSEGARRESGFIR